MKPFYVLNWDINQRCLKKVDVIPYLMYLWKDKTIRRIYGIKNSKRESVERLIRISAPPQYGGRVQYEILISSWPEGFGPMEKIDVWYQIEMNFDIIIDVFMENLKEERKNAKQGS